MSDYEEESLEDQIKRAQKKMEEVKHAQSLEKQGYAVSDKYKNVDIVQVSMQLERLKKKKQERDYDRDD